MSRSRLLWELGLSVVLSGPTVLLLHELSHALAALLTGGVVLEIASQLDHGAVVFRSPRPTLVFLAGPLGATVAACGISSLPRLRTVGCVLACRAALEATRACIWGSPSSDPSQAALAGGAPSGVVELCVAGTVWVLVGSLLWKHVAHRSVG